MEELRFSQKSVLTSATERHILEDGTLHCHRRENLKPHILSDISCHGQDYWNNMIMRHTLPKGYNQSHKWGPLKQLHFSYGFVFRERLNNWNNHFLRVNILLKTTDFSGNTRISRSERTTVHVGHAYRPCWQLQRAKQKKQTPWPLVRKWTIPTERRNLVPTFVDRGVSRGQRGGSLTVVNLSFLDRSRYFSFK
jgi:hypothetical protein